MASPAPTYAAPTYAAVKRQWLEIVSHPRNHLTLDFPDCNEGEKTISGRGYFSALINLHDVKFDDPNGSLFSFPFKLSFAEPASPGGNGGFTMSLGYWSRWKQESGSKPSPVHPGLLCTGMCQGITHKGVESLDNVSDSIARWILAAILAGKRPDPESGVVHGLEFTSGGIWNLRIDLDS